MQKQRAMPSTKASYRVRTSSQGETTCQSSFVGCHQKVCHGFVDHSQRNATPYLGKKAGLSDACPAAAPTPHVYSLPSISKAALWHPMRSLPAEARHIFGGGICSANLQAKKNRILKGARQNHRSEWYFVDFELSKGGVTREVEHYVCVIRNCPRWRCSSLPGQAWDFRLACVLFRNGVRV